MDRSQSGHDAPDAPSATIRSALLTIVVAGLGYFEDLFDLLLFSVVGFALLGLRLACTSVGDVSSGLLSQWWHSRRAAVALFLALLTVAVAMLLSGVADTARGYLMLVGLLGFGSGYWAVMITMAVEQFGTNVRATVGTSVPTFVRARGVLITMLFLTLRDASPISELGNGRPVAVAAAIAGTLCVLAAIWALATTRETYGRDLRFTEELT